MGLAERQSFPDQIVCQIRSIGKIVRHRPPHPVSIYRHGSDHVPVDLKRKLHRVNGIKQAFLVFLQIFIIRQRQAFQCSQHSHQLAVDAARLAPHQLGNIRIFLLGHHGGTSGKRIIQLHKTELRTAPQAQLFGQAAHVHHQYRGKRKEIQHIIPVADRIHAVCIHIFKI